MTSSKDRSVGVVNDECYCGEYKRFRNEGILCNKFGEGNNRI